MSTSPSKVVVVGNAGVDTNIYLAGAEIDFSVEANFTENIDCVGQAGGYASRGYAALGYRTVYVGALGDDHAGALVRTTLAREGVDTHAVFLDPRGTARSVNLMYPDGRRKNFYDGKAHMQLQPDLAACQAALHGARLAHINIPNWARHLLPLARALGITVACDIQDVVSLDDGYRHDFIAAADVLFFSAANHADPAPLMAELLRRNPRQIVIAGMGARGCAVGTHDGVRYAPPPPLDLPVVDTNGAGDALAVGFLSSYVLEGRTLDDSIRRGQIVARWTCAQRAPKAHLLTAEELARYAELVPGDHGS
jgi:acarbose 7IV-phosphotransferase